MSTIKSPPGFRGFFLALIATLTSVQSQAAEPSEVPCSSRYKLAWEMKLNSSDIGRPLENVLSRPEFSTARNVWGEKKRISIGRAPDSKVAIEMAIPKGANKSVTFFLDPLGTRGVEAACLSLKVFLPNGFEWPAPGGGTKMGWGLWGGTETRLVSGGTPPSQQLGWSVRNVNSVYGFRQYSYNLNRPGKHGAYGPYGARWMRDGWDTGRWHTIELEVAMNTPGKADGYSQLWLDGKDRRTMTKLLFRNSNNWAIRGLMFNDMWGGTEEDPANWSPKAQRMWYADYKIYTPSGSGASQTSEQQSNSSAGGSSNTSSGSASASPGQLNLLAPSGMISGNQEALTWTPDPKASKYYVRVLTRRTKWNDRKDIYGGSVSPRACSNTQCSVNIRSLSPDQYEWMVRPYYGSRYGDYKTMAFDVVDAKNQADVSLPSDQQSATPSNGTTSSSTNSGGSGLFGAVNPKGVVSGIGVTLTWTPDPKASKYYFRIITKRAKWNDRKDIYSGSVSPRSCSSTQCSVNIPNLVRDQYEWMVRPYYGSRSAEYSVLAFEVR